MTLALANHAGSSARNFLMQGSRLSRTRAREHSNRAGPRTEVVRLGNVALRLQMREELTTKRLLWDGEQLRVTNSEAANRFLKTEYRAGWSV